MWHYLSHPRRVLWGCPPVFGTKAIGDVGSEWNFRWTVVIMITFLTAEKWGAHAWTRRGGSRTAFAWKLLWPRGRMRSLEEPTFVAELGSFYNKFIQAIL
jgi:hypothetical protein